MNRCNFEDEDTLVEQTYTDDDALDRRRALLRDLWTLRTVSPRARLPVAPA